MWRWRAVAALLFAALLQTAPAARAEESPESRAEALIRQGIELRQAGKDERALVMFQRAYDTLPTPRSAGQLGLSEMAVGYWLSAEQHLNEALQTPDHPWVAKNRASLQTAVTRVRSNIGELVVTGPPAGASLTVNRRAAGTFPLSEPVRVPKGRVEIEISAAGYVKGERTLQVAAGGRQEVTVTLDREPAAVEPPAARPVAPVPAPVNPAADPTPTTPAAPTADEPSAPGSTQRKVALALAIAGGAVLVGAVVETFIWQHNYNQFNDVKNNCAADVVNRGAAGCSDYYDKSESAKTLSIVGYAATAAFAGAAAIVYWTAPDAEPAKTAALACVPVAGPASAGLSCRLQF